MGIRISDLPVATAVESDDLLAIVSQVRTTNGTRRITAPNLLRAGGLCLYVDGTYGDDAQGYRGSLLPYLTLAAAKDAAQSGDTIVVFPGTYAGNDLLKHGVNWHFMTGAAVVHDMSDPSLMEGSTAVPAIFDDNNAAVTSRITGRGEFFVQFGIQRWDDSIAEAIATNVNRYAFVRTRHADTDLTIEFESANYAGYSSGGRQMCYFENHHQVTLRGREMNTTNEATTYDIAPTPPNANGPFPVPDNYGGIWWKKGETYIDVDILRSGTYALYPEGGGVSTLANLWVRANLIESWSSTTIYFNGAANSNYKLWVTCQELRQSGANNVLSLQGVGKIYIDALKIGNVGTGIIGYASGESSGAMEVWINTQKISCGDTAGFTVFSVGNGTTNTVNVYLTCQHFDATANGTAQGSFIETNGANATLYINGGVSKMTQNFVGIHHVSGKTIASGVRIECNSTNDADNIPARATGAGLILDGCTLLAAALADSIGGNATVKVYGNTYANKAKNGSVTIQAGLGTLVVDAAVT